MPDTKRISESALGQECETLKLPYDRKKLTTGVVHLGIGAFHRAHQSVYTHRALAAADAEGGAAADEALRWGTVGVTMRSPTVRDQLAPQDCLYTVHERSSSAPATAFAVGVVLQCLVAPEEPEAVVKLLASPEVRVVTLTVTEKGYCVNPATGSLNLDHPDVRHDLTPEGAKAPKSAVAFLCRALAARREAGVEPFTTVPCDNMPDNGPRLARAVVEFARAAKATGGGDDLAEWVRDRARFAATVVDCIVPATTPADVDAAAAPGGPLAGLRDEAMVVCEPFRQWIIEDAFGPLGRPPWHLAGARFVEDVAAFEEAKLRGLNGCHSCLAYLGQLCGAELISDALAKPALAAAAEALVFRDAVPTLRLPGGRSEAEAYGRMVFERFRNTQIKHKTAQVATDGSQKLPQRLLATSMARAKDTKGGAVAAPLAVAAWMRYVTRAEAPAPDAILEDLRRVAEEAKGDPEAIAAGLFGLTQVFGGAYEELAREGSPFREAVTAHLRELTKCESAEQTEQYVARWAETLGKGDKDPVLGAA